MSELIKDSGNLDDAKRRATAIARSATQLREDKGIDTLYIALGIATWHVDSGTAYHAPVAMIPLQITAQGKARQDFDLQVAPEEANINILLGQRLQADFQIAIDPTPEGLVSALSSANPLLDLLYLKRVLLREWAEVPGLKIDSRAVIGIFKYANLPMVTDLAEANLEQIAENDFVAAMAGWEPARQSLQEEISEPPENKPDTDPPDSEYLVLTADSSQSRAVNRVLAGGSLVIWGPPGTGKSQTIANLISSLIAEGKRVLFVAQKRAAIDVVHQRLENVGLGDLVMDVHGGFSSKREFWQDVGKSLEIFRRTPHDSQEELQGELVASRDALIRHDEMLHGDRPWGLSLYQMQLRRLQLEAQARTTVRLGWSNPHERTAAEVRQIRGHIEEYVALGGMSLALDHPEWASAPLRTSEEAEITWSAANLLESLIPQTEALLNGVGFAPSESPTSWRPAVRTLTDVHEFTARYGTRLYTIEHEKFQESLEPFRRYGDELGSEATERLLGDVLTTYHNAISEFRRAGITPPLAISGWASACTLLEGVATLCSAVDPNILHLDLPRLTQDLNPARKFHTRVVGFISPRYRAAKQLVSGLSRSEKPLGGREALGFIEGAARCVEQWRVLYQDNSFPVLAENLDGLTIAVNSFVGMVKEIGARLNEPDLHNTQYDQLEIFIQPLASCLAAWHSLRERIPQAVDAGGVDALEAARIAQSHIEEWKSLSRDGSLPRPVLNLAEISDSVDRSSEGLTQLENGLGRDFSSQGMDDTLKLVQKLSATRTVATTLPRIRELEDYFREKEVSNFLQQIRADLPHDSIADALEWAWLDALLINLDFRELGNFDPFALEQSRQRFIRRDKDHVDQTPARIRRAVAVNATDTMSARPMETRAVRAEAGKRSRHQSPRTAFRRATSEVLIALRPAWMISPLMVAEMLPQTQDLFDVVIFDEASQIPPEEAIGSLARAKQAVIAGDNRQLPPTDFFRQAHVDDADDDFDEDEETNLPVATNTAAFESILDVFSSDLPLRKRMLEWHYRSRDSRLIASSNEHLYEGALTTFPGTREDGPFTHHLIEHRPIPAMNQRSNRSNPDEVDRVVELVLEHARTRPTESLGVIAFGQEHASKIQEALDNRRNALIDEGAESFFERHSAEPFFVKNIERVQGDERDVIILSVGYRKNNDGRLVYNFGALNRQGGERRLNVAISRARSHLHLVSSFSHIDMQLGRSNARGVELLRQYLEYVSSGGMRLGGEYREHPLNAFELDVKSGLEERGIPNTPQFGVSGYRIDFALAHPNKPGQFVLALEADGDSYHKLPTVRDRDRLRQSVLEDKGWSFHRLSSTAWTRNRQNELDKIEEAWRRAVEMADSQPQVSSQSEEPQMEAEDPAPTIEARPQRTERRPFLLSRNSIEDYEDYELIGLLRWIESDTLLRTDQELKQEMTRELGFKRLGSRIDARLTQVIKQWGSLRA
ncbi:MAG: AAA domain-containing protein [Chloroflexi bacterium]|nr:AAA domain-containing protein [Chloroflexota bacterium]